MARATVRPGLEFLEDRTLLNAPTFLVNRAGDAGIGTGTSGDIRYCIQQADLTPNSGAIISFDAGSVGNTITLSHGELEISNTMTITGPGSGNLTITGTFKNAASRVFNVTSNEAVVTISGLTITGGNGSPLLSTTPGNQGGDVFNGGNLTLQNDVVENGFVLGAVGGPPARGGGIFNAEGQNGASGASLTLDNTLVTLNVAQGANGGNAGFFGGSGGAGGFGAGGGIYNDSNASVTLINASQIIANQALGGHGGNGLHGLNGANATIKNQPGSSGQAGGSGGAGGAAFGGGLYSNANSSLTIVGNSTGSILFTDNIAEGGFGGNGDFGGKGGNGNGTGKGGAGGGGGDGAGGGSALGGGIYNVGSIASVSFAQFVGDQALGARGGVASFGGTAGNGGGTASGGIGGPGGSGGDGGAAFGGGIYSAGGAFTIDNSQFLADALGVGDQAIGGAGNNASHGGKGGNGGGKFFRGGAGGGGGRGGNGGDTQGGGVDNLGGALKISNTTNTLTLSQGGNGGVAGKGGTGGTGGSLATGGAGGAAGAGGLGGAAQGGGVFNSGSALSFNNYTSTNSKANGGNGNTAGTGGTGGVGGKSASGGVGAAGGLGGAGGAAQGGGFFVINGALTVTDSQFISKGLGNIATSGSGGTGGVGGIGGKGGNGTAGGPGGHGGHGGAGGEVGIAQGGAGGDQGDVKTSVSGSTFTANLVQAGNGGNGGNGGVGGKGGDGTTFAGIGGDGGDAGDGGSGNIAQGGALVVTSGSLNLTSSTFGGASTLANQVLGGTGGTGGTGGLIGLDGAPVNAYSIPPFLGNGGRGGDGTSVLGGAISVGIGKPPSELTPLSSYQGIDFNQSGGFVPPDTQGGAGQNEYVETVNSTVGIFSPKTTGTTVKLDSLDHFLFTVGGLPTISGGSLADAFSTYDSSAQRFVVGDIYSDFNGNNAILLAVSKTNNPKSLTAADWNFFEINTSEPGISFQDYPGNLGYNADALIITENSFGATGSDHTLVNAISIAALKSGATLTKGTNYFQSDISALLPRPATMSDAQPGGPMWFVESDGGGGQIGLFTGEATTINVLKMTNVLSSNPTFTTTVLNVNPYYLDVPALQPDGSPVTTNTDSRIDNADEMGGLLVAAQNISDKPNGTANRDLARWYEINVNGATPTLVQEGDVSGGPNTYDVYPGIAVNAQGSIGMSFIQSGTTSGQFESMYITGRLASDPLGTMQTPIQVQAGIGDQNDQSGRQGDMSAMNVDSDGTFWAANQYAKSESFLWGTAIAHFSLNSVKQSAQNVSISDSTLDNGLIVGGTGGQGGQGGLTPIIGTLGGNCGDGGNGGDANGGALALSSTLAANATLSTLQLSLNSATGGVGGAGGIQDRSNSGAGGNGGTARGGAIASVDYKVSASLLQLLRNTAMGGAGGVGGTSSLVFPDTSAGGNGGNGGAVLGGGFAFINDTSASLLFTDNGGTTSNNLSQGGVGGLGGAAGTDGHDHILGGSGGSGGTVQGGGLYIFSNNSAVITTTIANLSLVGNTVTAGNGGLAGAGASTDTGTKPGLFAAGGSGGDSQGGGLFNDSLNTASAGTLTIGGTTIADNVLTSGNGGIGGTGTTSNGGPGGNGGNAGNAEGGGIYGGNHTNMTVFNSTIGGLSGDPNNPATNGNTLSAGSGGAGNNAGTPAGVPVADGGNGGTGGNVAGGGIYLPGGTANLVNVTLVNNQAITNGLGGAPGSGAGAGGLPGVRGSDGTANAGGYFAGAGTTNTIGNTIIAQNNSPNSADVQGAFTSAGNNLLTSITGATGFNTGSGGNDQIVSPAQLNMGPLLDNGGTTTTDALLNGSVAIDAGNNNLVTLALFGNNPTDQRGTGFTRIYNNTVDVGAFEFQGPTIASISPNSAMEGSGSFIMTITGTGFSSGSTVSFGGTILTPTSVTSSQLTVTIPGPIPIDSDGPIMVMVENPDGSGITGSTINSAAVPFTITEAPFSLNTPPNQTNDVSDTVSLAITPVAPDDLSDLDNFVASGLPDGLTINQATGVISGVISGDASGKTFSVTITANDGPVANDLTASVSFSWVVNPFTLQNPGDQTNNEGDPVSLQITSSSGVPASNYTATGLPTGLTIDPNSGIISGTIDARGAGTYTVIVDAGASGATAPPITFSWLVNDTTPPGLTAPSNQTNFVGDIVNLPITSVDADSFSATGLPAGLAIDPTLGTITGTIATGAQGNYTTTITAADGNVTTQVSFNWAVAVPFGLQSPGTQNNDEGDQVSVPMAPVPGYTANSYSASALPAGLSIDPQTGVISGTIDPRAAGTYNVTVRAMDAQGQTTGVSFTWNVADTTPPSLTNPGIQQNKAGDVINHFAIQAADADPGTFAATGLPPGLSINAQTGVISGTISSAASGNYSVTIQAADGTISSAPMSFLWSVTAGSNSGGGNGNGGGNGTGSGNGGTGSGTGGLPNPPPGTTGLTTNLSIISVQNQYPGLSQLETVVVAVTNPNGFAVNQGLVSFQVDGQTVVAPVVNGIAAASVSTSLFDFGALLDLFFSHSLTASYGDNTGVYTPSGQGTTVPAIWIDFFLSLLASQVKELSQFQV